MTVSIACIVEGHGEVRALPILIRNVMAAHDLTLEVKTETIRVPKSLLLRPGELERAADLAARRGGRYAGILVLIDSDKDCPASLAPVLATRLRQARGDRPSAVVFAKSEFEAWFLAGAESLRGQRGLSTDLVSPADPEGVRGAKQWLDRNMARKYAERIDQPALSALLDLDMAAAGSRSFRKLRKEIIRLCSEAQKLAS